MGGGARSEREDSEERGREEPTVRGEREGFLLKLGGEGTEGPRDGGGL